MIPELLNRTSHGFPTRANKCFAYAQPLRFPFRRRRSPRPDLDLACGVWAEGAAEDVPHEEFFDVLRLHAGPLHRRFAELDCRDIGESGVKVADEVDFLEHCFIAKCVLIGSSNYFFFTAGPKLSTSSFHEAMILAFVFRAL
jgi:hypothetical protein